MVTSDSTALLFSVAARWSKNSRTHAKQKKLWKEHFKDCIVPTLGKKNAYSIVPNYRSQF